MSRIKVLVLMATVLFSLASSASLLSDPGATVTCSSSSADFYKELNGYGKYGTADAASDILYNGESGSWNFGSLAGCLPLSSYGSATVTFSLAADDNNGGVGGLATGYAGDIVLNGTTAFSGAFAGLQYGTPYNGPFTNWTTYSFVTIDLSTPFIVALNNVVADNGWIGIDYIDVRLDAAAAVPEPSSLLLFASGILAMLAVRRRLVR